MALPTAAGLGAPCGRRFLLDTFGREKLGEGAGVLGGRAGQRCRCVPRGAAVQPRPGCSNKGSGSLRRGRPPTPGARLLAADVAGGKGEVGFELLNLNGLPATVLEPRPLELQRRVKWLLVRAGAARQAAAGVAGMPQAGRPVDGRAGRAVA